MSEFTTPERVIVDPVAPGAPDRIQRTLSDPSYFIDFESTTRRLDVLLFPDIEEDYYSLEDRLANVTLFRGNRPTQSDDEMSDLEFDDDDDDDDVDTVVDPLNFEEHMDDDATLVLYPRMEEKDCKSK
jgi:hypothetical protein